MNLIRSEKFLPEVELAAFRDAVGNAGAIASFIGLVRDDGRTESLTLTHYPGFTEAHIERFITEAKERWLLSRILVIHRVGKMKVGEPIVCVAVAGLHRRETFEACDFLMDKLKTEAPFWKQETRAGATTWIEPKSQDKDDLKRWV